MARRLKRFDPLRIALDPPGSRAREAARAGVQKGGFNRAEAIVPLVGHTRLRDPMGRAGD
jgi:hypothetical protein